MQRALIVVGSLMLAAGVSWPWLRRLGLGRLPGDIAIEREGFHFYFPVTTMILVSIVVTLILWLLRK